MTFQLASADDVGDRLALAVDTTLGGIISSALDATTIAFEAMLDTTFTAGTSVDLFNVESTYTRSTSGFYLLRLKKGFVKANTIALTTGSTLDAVTLSLSTADTLLDLEKGFLRVPDTIDTKYLKASYGYGFGTLSDVPGWLTEAAIAYTIKMLSLQQIGTDKPDLSKIYKFVGEHYTAIMDAHSRHYATATKPIN